jgi:hypothetical protein
VIVPEGETNVAEIGGGGIGVVNESEALQGPNAPGVYVWTHHWHEPITSVVGVMEHVPVPEEQPHASAVYHCWILLPVASLTYSWYHMASETAFQM